MKHVLIAFAATLLSANQTALPRDMPPYTNKAFEMYNDRAYKQDQAPVVEQDRAVGHAVRAMYLYAAVADVAALSSNDAFARAADHLCRTSSPSACI